MKSNWGLWTVRKGEDEKLGEFYVVLRYFIPDIRYFIPDGENSYEEYARCKDEETAVRKAMELNKNEVTEQRRDLCRLLLPVLQETANLSDLKSLTYEPETERVVATFENGAQKTATVACDSGTAAIVDIVRQIV